MTYYDDEDGEDRSCEVPAVRASVDEADGGSSQGVPELQTAEVGHAQQICGEQGSVEAEDRALGAVYIVETIDKTRIKIGYTNRLTMRMAQIRTLAKRQYGCDFRLIGFFPGTIQHEAALHRILAPYRVQTEWYDHAAVMRHIARFGLNAEARQKHPQLSAQQVFSIMGKNGGPARARSLSPERRAEIAKIAAMKRWERKR